MAKGAQAVMGKKTKVAILDGGEMWAKEYMVFWNLPSEKPIRLPSYSVLIDHEDGLYLFDSGFDLVHFNQEIAPSGATQTTEQSLAGQLSLLNLKPNDIDYVVNSHFHFDHCGGNKHCSHARTICHKCELEAAVDPQPFEARIYSDRSFLPAAFDIEQTLTKSGFETIDGDQEIAKGLHLFETPGHTLGHYSLMIELSGRRPMLFTGDACYTKMGLDMMIMPSSHIDPVRGYQSMERLKSLAVKHDAELFFGHDDAAFESFLKAPAWYE
jgi:4-pyridoxolactonase